MTLKEITNKHQLFHSISTMRQNDFVYPRLVAIPLIILVF